MKLNRVSFLLVFTALLGGASSSNILGMFITHVRSHLIVHMAVVRALVERGHNVTVITSQPLNELNPGYRHIFLKTIEVTQDDVNEMLKRVRDSPALVAGVKWICMAIELQENNSKFPFDPEFRKFIKEDNQFDLMLLGYELNEYQLGVAAHFRCPVILSWMFQPIGHVSRLIGNPTLPSFVPAAPFMSSKPMNFFARVQNMIVVAFEEIFSTSIETMMKGYYKKFTTEVKFPSLAAMRDNISLIFVNHHFSERPVRPLVPGLVEIGGIQIKEKSDPLPEEIDLFLENSPQGAILFSLGSYIRNDYFNQYTIDLIYKVLSTLPYNIIWKSDSIVQEKKTSNILFKSWLPQNDILAHRNLKLFITHAGKGGITESIYHGVPMVALPILDDQPGNADLIQSNGYGLTLDHSTLTEESFRKAVLEVIQNDKYKTAIKQFSQIYRDRPLTARETVVYWTEYVIRHKGALHMQSPLKKLNFIQKNNLDTIAFTVLVIYVMLWLAKMFLRVLRKIVNRLVSLIKAKQD